MLPRSNLLSLIPIYGSNTANTRLSRSRRLILVSTFFKYFMDLKTGSIPGRTNSRRITFFINAGTQGLQFASCAGRVYQLAKEKGVGRELPTEWFLQDIRD